MTDGLAVARQRFAYLCATEPEWLARRNAAISNGHERRRQQTGIAARNAEIVEKCKTRTLADVGAEYGLTRERVRQICKRAGLMQRAGHSLKPYNLTREQRRIYLQGRQSLGQSREDALARALVPGATFEPLPRNAPCGPMSPERRAAMIEARRKPWARAVASVATANSWKDPETRAARLAWRQRDPERAAAAKAKWEAGKQAYWARVRAGEIPHPRAKKKTRTASASSPGGAVTAGPVAADGGADLSRGEG